MTSSVTGTRRGRAWLGKLALLSVSLVLVLVLLEIALRVLGFRPLYDTYSRPDAYWTADPLLGWALDPGAEGEFVGPEPFPVQFRSHIRVNADGLRGPELEALPDGGVRVLVLGDSQAAGFEVAEDATYAALLEHALAERLDRPVQVVVGAVRGYGTDQSYLRYVERLRGLAPDLVVHHTTANDPEDDTTLHRARRLFGKPAFAPTDDGEDLRLVGSPVPEYPRCHAVRVSEDGAATRVDTWRSRAFCRLESGLADRSALFSALAAQIQRNPRLLRLVYGLGSVEHEAQPAAAPVDTPGPSGGPAPPGPVDGAYPVAPLVAPPPDGIPHGQRLTSTLILRLAAAVRDDGAQFALLGEGPDLAQLDLSAFDAAGVPILRTDEALGPDQSGLRFPNDGHLNEEGHRRVAAYLAPRIEERVAR